MSKILVDTNVLVYAKDADSEYHQASIKLLEGSGQLFITSKNLTEYYAVVTKGEKPLLRTTEALNDIEEFISICKILYTSEITQQKLVQLILKYQPKGLLIHDFEIAAIALANDVKKLATFNRRDFQGIKEIELINLLGS